MMRVFASAAPRRLRQAALASAGPAPKVAPKPVREMQEAARRVLSGGADLTWISACPDLTDREAVGRSLTRWEQAEPKRGRVPDEVPRFRKSPAQALANGKRAREPAWLPPQKTTKPRPEATPSAEIKAFPPRLAGGQLRLRSRVDPEDLKVGAPENRKMVRGMLSRKKKAPLPGGTSYHPAQEQRALTAPLRAAASKPSAPLPPGTAGTQKAPWACDLEGPTASSKVLSKAAEGFSTSDRPRGGPDPDKHGERRDPAATSPKPRTQSKTADFLPGPPPSMRAAGSTTSQAARKASNSAEPPALHREPVHPLDPLGRETLSRPPHHTPVPLPVQPDLDPPFAEILPPQSRAHLGRFQEAVTDEPLTDLPGRTTPKAPAGFDQDALSEALARVLRDEARRHGIDV